MTMGAAREPQTDTGGGDEFALFAELYPQLRRFAAVVADIDMEPDDLVQDALAATLKRHRLGEIQRPAAYLKQAIVHAVTNHRRRAARFRRLVPLLGSADNAADNYPSDLAVLDVLAPTDRAIIFLSDVEGLTGAAIGEELGMTSGAVRKRISRSRRQLRLALGGDLELTAIPEERP